MENDIREVKIERRENGTIQSVTVVFGPHYFIELMPDEKDQLTLYLGATHHGFKAQANEVNGELEKFIYAIRDQFPNNSFD